MGQTVGHQDQRHQIGIGTELSEAYALLTEAASVSVALDRVSLPLEEAVGEAEREASLEKPGRQVTRQFRMASCATVTLHAREG